MIPTIEKALAGDLREQRLRLVISIFFLALAIPTAALAWKAYSQLKWEAFHQHRGMAEELTRRINTNLQGAALRLEAHSFADYSFLVVSGAPGANFLQPSVLSAYPVASDLPGLLGYFQVGSEGEFSTPVLPADEISPQSFGISNSEYREREELAHELQAILSNNQLVNDRPIDGAMPQAAAAEAVAATAGTATLGRESDGGYYDEHPSAEPSTAKLAGKPERQAEAGEASREDLSGSQTNEPGVRSVPNSQLAFDNLNKPSASSYSVSEDAGLQSQQPLEAEEQRKRDYALGRVTDLKLDSTNLKKSADLELAEQRAKIAPIPAAPRLSRKEQTSLLDNAQNMAATAGDQPGVSGRARIRTFESEIDPMDFSQLDSGHFVMFRSVWRGGERFIQGILLDQAAFIAGAIKRPFMDDALSPMTVLVVAYQDEVLATEIGADQYNYINRAGDLKGELLFRSRLAAPFDALQLIYSVNKLPPAPGSGLIIWTSIVLVLVLCLGCYGLYRTGLRQMRLARQQQDFVSAISHELKTPITSIRMYGEMLKEGWANEDKKQSYYEFIYEESERLTRLISNVLQLSNISRDEPQLEMKSVSVKDLIESIHSKVETQIQRSGFELNLLQDRDCDECMVLLDSDHFTQIIINLVDNAIKFSRNAPRQCIDIGTRQKSNRQVEFFVRDYGPGIANDQMRKIFDMFYRSESELTRETVGTGIGLAIVQQLSAAMGAKVDVVNRSPGAEFQIQIPAIE